MAKRKQPTQEEMAILETICFAEYCDNESADGEYYCHECMSGGSIRASNEAIELKRKYSIDGSIEHLADEQ